MEMNYIKKRYYKKLNKKIESEMIIYNKKYGFITK